jgi:hypothetical protein
LQDNIQKKYSFVNPFKFLSHKKASTNHITEQEYNCFDTVIKQFGRLKISSNGVVFIEFEDGHKEGMPQKNFWDNAVYPGRIIIFQTNSA